MADRPGNKNIYSYANSLDEAKLNAELAELANMERSLQEKASFQRKLNAVRPPLSLPSYGVNKNFDASKLDMVSIPRRDPHQDFVQALIDEATRIGQWWNTLTTSKNPQDIKLSEVMIPISQKINILLTYMRSDPTKVNQCVNLLRDYVQHAKLTINTYRMRIGGKRNTRRRRQTRRVRKHK